MYNLTLLLESDVTIYFHLSKSCLLSPSEGLDDSPGSDGLLPVLFNIYGGTFIHGHAMYGLYGPQFILEQRVVVVTINYRGSCQREIL
ncbi:hypothetical protein NQ317_005949 [Molorchus minor]|uniref:Carboxylesterase type B domain-containing protein n=1 Tax=Molorchus minor TaxID=1323400 RepID=A0ABQ9IR87_9CUCU|nr:hypothetical protein NQ317_005949 [Molorchus minor]